LAVAVVCTTVVSVSAMERHSHSSSVNHRHMHARRHATKRHKHLIDKRKPDLKSYHSADQLTAEFKALTKNCPHLKIETKKGAKTSLTSISISKPDKAPNEALSEEKLKVLMFFGEHAREIISPETALRFTQMLCQHTPTGFTPPSTAWTERIATVLDRSDILMFPLINVDGHNKVTHGSYCTRTNRRGVDLNRNWDDHWKHATSRADTNSGRTAFSEEEVRLLRDAANTFRPDMFVSVHSGALGMYTPYAYSTKRPSGPVERSMVSILKKLNHHSTEVSGNRGSGYCNCDVGAAGKELNYLCPGTCLDYMFDKLLTPYAFAVEIWDGSYGYKKQPQTAQQRSMQMFQSALIESKSGAVKSALTKNAVSTHHAVSEADADALNLGSCFIAHDRSAFRESQRHHSDAAADTAEEQDESHEAESESSFAESESDSHALFPIPRNSEDHTCLASFNPTNTRDYIATTDNWSRLLIDLIEEVRRHPERAPKP